ncbi:MAG: efflux RND transporter permease subunit [Verrucomicrobiae bacterium]|nr:efflux RND transporter permease subunit [Verrucomicrobiae bacterium]
MPPPSPELPPQDRTEEFASTLTRVSLRRRVTVLVLLLAILVVGVVATVGIPLELFPRGYTGHSLNVWVPWQDAPVQEVLQKITLPLEEELSTVRGLDGINSYSGKGSAGAFLRFKRGTDMDVAYREVRDRVQRARLLLPSDADRIFIRKEDASGIPVAVIGMAIDPGLTDYYTLIRRQVVQRFERLDGVANVRTDGLEEKEILIEVNRQRAESSGLNLYQLSQELASDNFSLASGTVRDAGRKRLLRSLAQYRSVEEIENLPLSPSIRLKDIAAIRLEEPDKRYSVRVNSRPAVAIVVFKEGEANTVEVSRRIRDEVERLRTDPRMASIYMEVLFNQGRVIEDSLANLVRGGLLGAGLAALILFFFLRRFRLTAIVTLSIPLSLLIALVSMFFGGESLNILTILALVIAVGMLVDNSIVVAENIHRHHREGWSRFDACVRGAGEIALAITMATLTTVIVFVPAALVEGEGQFFLIRLAWPISVALLASLAVALVFIPLSVYLTLPSTPHPSQPSLWNRGHLHLNAALRAAYEASLGRLNRLYVRTLDFFLARRLDLILLLIAAFALTFGWAFRKVELVSQQEEDRTNFQLRVEASNEYSFEDLGEYFREVEDILAARQEELGLKGYFVFYRQRGGQVEGWIDTDRPRSLSAKQLAEKVQEALPKKPGIRIFHGDENRAQEARGKSVFVVHLEGDDAAELDALAARVQPLFLAVDGVLGIRRGEEAAPSEMALRIDRDRAAAVGVNPEVIAGLVGYALRGNALPKYNDRGREIPVRLRFREADRETLAELGAFQIPTADGGRLPLAALTDSSVENAPRGIFRRNKRTTRSITLELRDEQSGPVRERLTAIQNSIALPEGVTFGSTAVDTSREDLLAMQFAATLSVVFIYLLMAFLFESFVLPLSIICTIPLAGIGVVWIHFLTGRDLDFLGVVGIILLIGVVVNNGIVLVDYINRLIHEGQSRRDALLHAAERRFRPILMTALTTIVGMVPLTLSAPSETGLSYKSFGLTLIGGMSAATLLTLLVVPVFYTLFDDLRGSITRGWGLAGGRGRVGSLPACTGSQ